MDNNNFKISENDIKAEDMDALNNLLKQLNPEAPVLGMEKLNEVASHGIILSLRDISKSNLLIGMGTLIPIRKLFSFCGTIEDVVVDENYRGKGLGKELMNKLVEKSRQMGMKFTDLTSKPERVKANGLYQSIGFEKRETNVYRLYN